MLLAAPFIHTSTNPAFGYIGGDAPDGLVREDGSPVALVVIDAFETSTRAWVRSTLTDKAGEYKLHGLPVTGNYFLVARPVDPAYMYEVRGNVTPKAY